MTNEKQHFIDTFVASSLANGFGKTPIDSESLQQFLDNITLSVEVSHAVAEKVWVKMSEHPARNH